LPQDFVRRCGGVLGALFDLEADIWDQYPELARDIASIEARIVDLGALVSDYEKTEEPRRRRLSQFIADHLPASMHVHAEHLDDASSRTEIQRWWGSVEKPYLSPEQLTRGLRHERRYYRVRTALFIEKHKGISLFTDDRTDVDDAKVQAWSQNKGS
jgi:hypothetical protein